MVSLKIFNRPKKMKDMSGEENKSRFAQIFSKAINGRNKKFWTLLSLVFLLFIGQGVYGQGSQTKQVILTTPGEGSWIVPAGVTSITVEAWGAGGAGGNGRITGRNSRAGGGGGGAYTKSTLTVSPSNPISYVIGSGAVSSTSRNTTFSNTITAIGGTNGTAAGSNASGGAGGTGTNNGGAGAAGVDATAGGGGGGGGSGGNGGNASSGTAGSGGVSVAGENTPGGNGGDGSSTSGNNGITPGGGGAGGNGNNAGGAGGNGLIIIRHYPDKCVNFKI
jgi:hypothetical protein